MQCVFHMEYSFGTTIHCTVRCKTINNLRLCFFSVALPLSISISLSFSLLFHISFFFDSRWHCFFFSPLVRFSCANVASAPANGIILLRTYHQAKQRTKIARLQKQRHRPRQNNWEHKYYMVCSHSWTDSIFN